MTDHIKTTMQMFGRDTEVLVAIPEDVMKTATTAGNSWLFTEPKAREELNDVIARAIMAERERNARKVEEECARLLAKQDGSDEAIDANLRLMACVLPSIAAAIRKGEAA